MASIRRAIERGELFVARSRSKVVGFLHCVMHGDIVDGALNAFITAFYVSPAHRGKGVGRLLLKEAIADSLSRGAVGVETSTLHLAAKHFYERNHFRQAFFGDIGEVFLELDVNEYLQAEQRWGRKTASLPRRASS